MNKRTNRRTDEKYKEIFKENPRHETVIKTVLKQDIISVTHAIYEIGDSIHFYSEFNDVSNIEFADALNHNGAMSVKEIRQVGKIRRPNQCA